MYQVIIIGGGLGGLLTAILLGRAGISTLVIEKKIYPFHKVCGEYISNEVTSYLHSIGLFPLEFSPPKINRLQISSKNDNVMKTEVPQKEKTQTKQKEQTQTKERKRTQTPKILREEMFPFYILNTYI